MPRKEDHKLSQVFVLFICDAHRFPEAGDYFHFTGGKLQAWRADPHHPAMTAF